MPALQRPTAAARRASGKRRRSAAKSGVTTSRSPRSLLRSTRIERGAAGMPSLAAPGDADTAASAPAASSRNPPASRRPPARTGRTRGRSRSRALEATKQSPQGELPPPARRRERGDVRRPPPAADDRADVEPAAQPRAVVGEELGGERAVRRAERREPQDVAQPLGLPAAALPPGVTEPAARDRPQQSQRSQQSLRSLPPSPLLRRRPGQARLVLAIDLQP